MSAVITADGRTRHGAGDGRQGRWSRVRSAAPLDPDRRQRLETPARRSTSSAATAAPAGGRRAGPPPREPGRDAVRAPADRRGQQVRVRDPPALLPDSDSPRPRRRCSSSPTAGTPPGRLPGSSEAAAAAGKLDRLGRNLAHLVNAVQDLAAHGVRPAVLVSSVDGTGAARHDVLIERRRGRAASMESVTVAFDPRAAVIRYPDLEAVEARP